MSANMQDFVTALQWKIMLSSIHMKIINMKLCDISDKDWLPDMKLLNRGGTAALVNYTWLYCHHNTTSSV